MPDRPRYASPLAWFRHREGRDEDAPLSAESRFSEVLAALPAVERSALALSEIGGLDEDEIAERLGTSVPVVRSLLVRARSAARSRLRERTGCAALLPQLLSWLTQGGAPAARAAGAMAIVVVGTGAVASTVASEASAERPRETRSAAVALVREEAPTSVRVATVARTAAPPRSSAAKPRARKWHGAARAHRVAPGAPPAQTASATQAASAPSAATAPVPRRPTPVREPLQPAGPAAAPAPSPPAARPPVPAPVPAAAEPSDVVPTAPAVVPSVPAVATVVPVVVPPAPAPDAAPTPAATLLP